MTELLYGLLTVALTHLFLLDRRRDSEMSTFASRIRRVRAACKITQSDLARKVGVQRSAVAQWEQPDGTTPSVASLSKIATMTDVNFEWLATGRGAMKHKDHETTAVVIEDYAYDHMEGRLLQTFRQLSTRKREALLGFLESLVR